MNRITREETINFKLNFDSQKLNKTEFKMVKERWYQGKDVVRGDDLTINYSVDIAYWGRVVDDLSLLLMLFHKATPISANTTEIKHDQCVIQEVFALIEQLENKFKSAGGVR